jgi:HK97 family phage portal protein
MAFSIFRRLNPSLSDLSDRDKKELFSAAEAAMQSRVPNAKERTYIEQRIGVSVSKLADFQSFIDVGSKRVWASFRACHLVGSVLMSANMRVNQVNKQGEATALDRDHPAALFLQTPNPFDSWEEMTYMWTFHMKLTGTAYLLKDSANGKGQPLGIYPLLPQYVEADPDPLIKVKGWKYKVNGQIINLTPEQVIQFRRPHPNNLIMGMGDVEPSQDLFSAYIGRGDLEKKFLENGAQPSGILTRKFSDSEVQPDEGIWDAFKRKFNLEYSGKNNAGKTAFLSGEWNYQKLGLTMQEMQAIERERWTIEQVFLTHGVPLSVAGLKNAANYATAKQDEINFRKHECVPLLNLLVGRLNMAGGLASAYGEGIRYDYDLTGLIDVESTVRENAPLVRLGAMTPNQLREACGFQKIDDPYLDQYFIEQGLVPIAVSGMSSDAAQTEDIKSIVSGTQL